ncbi:armadillo repeat-containing protein 3 [Frieseomelitta varia]|uniref:armadillo repeat-containing protein 3 n=1 Tax=Frieseomelitta varia TaxID=561572 RepID=UPI001CB6A657|nr:armadillo repeat-containing protein 3 [Frieseomelitta varia]
MGPKREIKYVSKGKTRIDREQQTKNQFDPLRLEVKYPGTTIHLLQCDEKPILLAAAAALAKFGGKCRENLQLLFDLEITDSVIPLITHEDLFTRRFALKLLAEMVAIPNVRDFLLDSDYYIPHFIKVLINETDTFMHEFSSLILAEITKDVYGTAQLLKHCPDMNFLHERLQSPDPDVKMNTMQIVHNLLQDPIGAEEIIETKSFDLQLVYDLFDSPYTEIQKLALDVVADLVRRNKDDRLHDRFRRTNGLGALLKFLDNIEWEDLHADALRILRFACDNPTTVELFDDIGGIRHMLKYIEDTSNSRLFMEALGIAVRLSHTARGRKVTYAIALYDYGIVDYLLNTLMGHVQADMYEISCHGIGMMTLYNEAAKDLTTGKCVKNILDILKNENLKLSTRLAALFALNQLLKCDAKNCQEFLDIHGQNYLLWLMRQPAGRVPVEILVGAVECVITIVRNQALRHTVITPEIIDAMSERKKHNFVTCTTYKNDDRSMLNNRSTARVVPSWDTCIETLFDAHLPIKFAFTGRLSLHDVTRDGFYVLRRNICSFPILDDIFRFKFCPLEPIYVVNCIQENPYELSLEGNRIMPSQTFVANYPHQFLELGLFHSTLPLNMTPVPNRVTPDTDMARASEQRQRRFLVQRDITIDDGLQVRPPVRLLPLRLRGAIQMQVDRGRVEERVRKPRMRVPRRANSYNLRAFQRRVSRTTRGFVDVGYVASRARMLAKFVARQMSGPDPLVRCVDHQLEIHLKEIKRTIETSVIPLGMLKVGSYFERALLFKVIADRVHLPAALVRGQYGKAWIEIAVPEDSLARSSSIFPTKLLKPNFIVDLMHSPGDLIPIGSERAILYCEKRLVCDTVC